MKQQLNSLVIWSVFQLRAHGDVYYGSLVIFLSYKLDALPSDIFYKFFAYWEGGDIYSKGGCYIIESLR